MQTIVHYVNEKDSSAAKYSVLAVDDLETSLAALVNILSDDYTVYTAGNGRGAISVAEKYLPDVILLDILMPDMDGYEVIAELKKSEKTKHIPIISITGLNDIDDEENGPLLGVADYITKPFSPAIVKLRVRNQIKMLEQSRIIERLSMIDQLTGLPNRRSFEAQVDAEWRRTIREATQLSILVIDVDHFKNYNDTWGHQQGDAALKSLAEVLKKSAMRPADFPARWGGEEFILLLPNTDAEGSLAFAETVRKNVEEMVIAVPNGPQTKITVSIGVNTAYKGSTIFSADELISGADMALYDAKKIGRNKVCHYKAEENS